MKNIFGINVTEDRANTGFDGRVFHKRTVSSRSSDALDAAEELAMEAERTLKLPLWLRAVKSVSGFLALIAAIAIIQGLLDSVSIAQAYQNAPELFHMAAVSFVLWLALFVAARKKMKSVMESDDYERKASRIGGALDSVARELDIPPDAKDIDILSFRYKMKKGKEKVVAGAFETYINLNCVAYVRDGFLHIVVSMRDEFVIPLTGFTGIERVNKKIPIPISHWNKETPFDKGEYKKYKMKANDFYIFFKPYYDFLIRHNGYDYKFSIPPYELDALSSLTGLEFNG